MTTMTQTEPTHCIHCDKPASRHYYGGWCTPAPDRIPSMSGSGICPAHEAPEQLTAREARDILRPGESLVWDLNIDERPTWYGLTSTGARNVYRTIGARAPLSADPERRAILDGDPPPCMHPAGPHGRNEPPTHGGSCSYEVST